MKNVLLFIVSMMCISNFIDGQSLILKSKNCNTIQLNQNYDKNEQPLLLLLEKELAQNVWVKVSSKASKENIEVFSDLKEGTYRVTSVINTNDKSYSNSVALACPVGNLENGKMFSVSPTPAINEVQLSIQHFSDALYTFNIFSIEGKVLKEGRLLDNQSSISLEGFKPGLYLINVFEGPKFLGCSKLIIQ